MDNFACLTICNVGHVCSQTACHAAREYPQITLTQISLDCHVPHEDILTSDSITQVDCITGHEM